MNLILFRDEYREDGVFGRLVDEHNNEVAVTLEHSYDSGNGDGSYIPKTPAGTYTCVRGQHQLNGMLNPFTTFEVTNVPGHTDILLHAGNFNKDSEGCILLGRRVAPNPDAPSTNMITSSKNTFNAFMDMQNGLNSFTLVVKDKA